MTTIEVSNITYESNRIQECKIIINGEEFNAKWEDPEYTVTDKKGSKERRDGDFEDEELISEKERTPGIERLGVEGIKKAKAIANFKKMRK